MKESTVREKVLKNIRNALISKSNNPYPNIDFESSVYTDFNDSLDITFAEEFSKVSGKFIYCESINDFAKNLQILIQENNWLNIFCLEEKIKNILSKNNITFFSHEKDFNKIEVGITTCEYLIARLGSIMVSSKQALSRKIIIYPPVHIVLAYTSQLVPDLKQALTGIKEKYNRFPSMISVITGPSRTADIEKTLVMGAHGPKELFVFLIDDSQ
jgi:L-lactate dehydrogenase complex protein LldG